MNFGIHAGQQDCSFADLKRAWLMADNSGMAWVSCWDHFYEAPNRGGTGPVFEAVSTMAALAAVTKNVRVGCLVYSAGYRPPAILAKAAVTMDHISNGRVTLGIGAGWHQEEYRAYGFDYGSNRERLDMLEESVQIIQSLLTKDVTTFEGKYYRVENARFLPKPVQKKLPVMVGGQGEKRTLRIAARHADAWNAAYIAPEVFKHKNEVLDMWCEKEKRDPKTIERSINLTFYMGADEKAAKRYRDVFNKAWGPAADRLARGSILGTTKEAIEQIAAFEKIGAKNLNIAFRPPFDWEAFQAFIDDVMPAFK
ncbi:MAG: TIGR03560 family F420-dependent LLM class oxidoreductase [Chloroflexi bacterium]|nr:TIGR03560 family F420-dependent LLM class oxidoreductase [Chloroflexota bacterium]